MQKEINLLVLPMVQNIKEIISGMEQPLKLTTCNYDRLEFRFKDHALSILYAGVDIRDFDQVWLSSNWSTRSLAYAVSLYLDRYNTIHTFVEQSTSKVSDQVIFILDAVPAPNTFFVYGHDISNYIAAIEDVCGYPLIIKDIGGAGGKYSAYVQNRGELLEKSAALPWRKKFLFQKFIPNDYDWGVLMVNGMVVSAEKSYPGDGEFRNNCNGAHEVFTNIALVPAHIKAMALKAAAALGLSWCRADIVVDRDTDIAYLMEINRCPGITAGSAEVAGARKFLQSQLDADLIPAENPQLQELIISKMEKLTPLTTPAA